MVKVNLDSLNKRGFILRNSAKKFGNAQASFFLDNDQARNTQTAIENLKGNRSLLDSPSVSVVGSRDASKKGLELARKFTKIILENDFVIVSGLAKGVDTVAHKTALELKGRTISALGTPFHKVYPAENKGLADDIAQSGLLLTTAKKHEEFGKHLFPRRNKLMAQISKATIVIEAGEKSGVKHQCAECLKNGKTLIFLKHQVDKGYKWVESFLASGAKIVETKEELIDILKNL